MDIKQIRKDFDTGVIIGRETWAELLAFAEQADAVIAGRQQAIGVLNMRIAELENRGVGVPRVRGNSAAHDWAVSGTVMGGAASQFANSLGAGACISPQFGYGGGSTIDPSRCAKRGGICACGNGVCGAEKS